MFIYKNINYISKRRNVETSELYRNVEIMSKRQNVKITSKRRNYVETSKLRIQKFCLNFWITHLNFISRSISFDFRRKFTRFFCVFKIYFMNYVIRLWKKIHPIFSHFQILFRELFICFGKKYNFYFAKNNKYHIFIRYIM